MKECKLTIITWADGEKQKLETEAIASEEGEFLHISYFDRGASVELWLGGTCRMRRRGEYSLDMRFAVGERTECRFSMGEASGAICVQTTRYELYREAQRCRILLEYTLEFSEETQSMRLMMTVIEEG